MSLRLPLMYVRYMLVLFSIITLVVSVSFHGSANAISTSLNDEFSVGYKLKPMHYSPDGKWLGKWNGHGIITTAQDPLSKSGSMLLQPKPATSRSATHSALVVSTEQFQNFQLTADVKIDKQLRQNSKPNSWESGWILWHYNDPTHHYYLALKTNGPEVGKYDGGANPLSQVILKTKSSPRAHVGQWNHVELKVTGNHIVAVIDGVKSIDFYDNSSFSSGDVALYSEDAKVSFDNVHVTSLAPAFSYS